MTSEREKMVAGAWYSCIDDELVRRRRRVCLLTTPRIQKSVEVLRRLCRQYWEVIAESKRNFTAHMVSIFIWPIWFI